MSTPIRTVSGEKSEDTSDSMEPRDTRNQLLAEDKPGRPEDEQGFDTIWSRNKPFQNAQQNQNSRAEGMDPPRTQLRERLDRLRNEVADANRDSARDRHRNSDRVPDRAPGRDRERDRDGDSDDARDRGLGILPTLRWREKREAGREPPASRE